MTSTIKSQKDHWSSEVYESAAAFVPKLSQVVLQLLDPQPTDRILDIGSGDGKFTANYLPPRTAEVYGVDSSATFVQETQTTYGNNDTITFNVVDCRFLEHDEKAMIGNWDKVISNAALHWILRDPSTRLNTLRAIFTSLRPGGKFVFEMGGAGNICEVQAAMVSTLVHVAGYSFDEAREAAPFFYPDATWMRHTLETIGFDVSSCELVHRPTRLEKVNPGKKGTEAAGGIEGWVRLMLGTMLDGVEERKGSEVKEEVVRCICESVQASISREAEFSDGGEWLSYIRLRGVAVKPSS